MNSETKNCQNCKKDFIIGSDDFDFYKKMDVRAPTWCVDCQLQRRLAWRNERNLHKRKCDVPGHEEQLISVYSPESPAKVYDQKFWWSDQWDALSYGKEYDFSKPFFQQWRNLAAQVPRIALFNINPSNSDFCNYTDGNKNCYLVFGGDFNENCSYSTFNFYTKDSFDLYFVNKCELSYEVVDSVGCYRSQYVWDSKDCSDSAFLANCVSCSNCFGCVNLRNKQYCIFNKQYAKEDYEKKVKDFQMGDHLHLQDIRRRFADFVLQYPRRYAKIFKSVNSTGDHITEAKNCINCFEIDGPAEDLKDHFLGGWNLRDSRNSNHAGHKVEMVYDSFAIFSNSQGIRHSLMIGGSHDIWYSFACQGSSHLFGCVGLRSKQYCILNKQYTKEEYEALILKIKKHMDEMPFTDSRGKVYAYGEFFPIEFAPFGYNETIAQEYFSLDKSGAAGLGLGWGTSEEKNYKPTLMAVDLPANINSAGEELTKEVIECEHKGNCNELCSVAFRILPKDLAFYKQMNVPLPRLCPSCRHYQRLRQRTPRKLWHRVCQCGGIKSENGKYTNSAAHAHGADKCNNEFQTPFAPERPEFIYCELCYQSETA